MKFTQKRNDGAYPFAFRGYGKKTVPEKKTILILGCGLMQRPAIETAKAWNWTVIGFDVNPHAEAVPLCDRFEAVDISDTEAVVSAARRLHAECGIDGVFTAGTDFSFNVASAAKALGLPGLAPEAAFAASNKSAMRAAFAGNGVSSPAFLTVASVGEAAAAARPPFPLVVKPVDNMGGRGTRRVDNEAELAGAVAEALRFSRSGKAIIEEYIDGPEFSLDALVCDGKVTITGFADRHIFFPPYFIEMGHTMPTAAPAEVRRAVESEFRKAVAALGLTTGAAKGDVKYSPARRKAVIGEVAARLSGGYMSGWTYPYASGINVTAAALRLAVGLPPALPHRERHRCSAERAFLSVPGEVVAVEGVETVLRRRCVRHLFMRAAVGDRVRFPRNNVEKCGNIITAARTRRRAVREADRAAERILIRLKAGDPQTEDYLIYGRGCGVFVPEIAEENRSEFFFKKKEENFCNLLISYTQKPLFIEEKDCDAAFGRGLKRLRRMELFNGGKKANLILDGLFWRVYRRGGVQGAVWLADSLQHFFKLGILNEVLEKWCGNHSSDGSSSD